MCAFGVSGQLAPADLFCSGSLRPPFTDRRRIALLNGTAADAQNSAGRAIERATESEKEAARLNKLAEDERLARIKLEALVSPRRLTPDQQHQIATVLKGFSGRFAVVSTYGLDGEGAVIGTQIMEALKAVPMRVRDERALTIVTGGFDFGIHIRGPANEQSLVMALARALHTIGKLDVYVNSPSVRGGAVLSGSAVIRGNAAMSGGGGPLGPGGPTPHGTPVTIAVGIKPFPK
jgi:hypothetical protein